MSSLALPSTIDVSSRKVWAVGAHDTSDYDTLKEQFGIRLQKLLDERGLKQADLARALGRTNPSEISRYVRGKVLPKPGTQVEIAQILGVSVGYLVYGENR